MAAVNHGLIEVLCWDLGNLGSFSVFSQGQLDSAHSSSVRRLKNPSFTCPFALSKRPSRILFKRTRGCSWSLNPQLACCIWRLEDRCAERLAGHSWVWHCSDYSFTGLHAAAGCSESLSDVFFFCGDKFPLSSTKPRFMEESFFPKKCKKITKCLERTFFNAVYNPSTNQHLKPSLNRIRPREKSKQDL